MKWYMALPAAALLLLLAANCRIGEEEGSLELHGAMMLFTSWDNGANLRFVINFNEKTWVNVDEMVPRQLFYKLTKRGSLEMVLLPDGDPSEYIVVAGRFSDVNEDGNVVLPFLGTATLVSPLAKPPPRADVRGEHYAPPAAWKDLARMIEDGPK